MTRKDTVIPGLTVTKDSGVTFPVYAVVKVVWTFTVTDSSFSKTSPGSRP